MPARSKAAPKPEKNKSLEQWIWDAACSIRGAKDAPKYKDFILPLIFTKCLGLKLYCQDQWAWATRLKDAWPTCEPMRRSCPADRPHADTHPTHPQFLQLHSHLPANQTHLADPTR
jgi:hypothetical protein